MMCKVKESDAGDCAVSYGARDAEAAVLVHASLSRSVTSL